MLLTRPAPIFPIVKSQKGRSHWYEIDGEKVCGVTTCSGLYPKGGLVQGAANAVARSVKERWTAGVAFKQEEIDSHLEECRKEYVSDWRGQADVGTKIHEKIHSFIEAGAVELQNEPEVVRNGFQAFLNWFYEHEVTFVASELVVGSRKHGFSGTLDGLGYVDKKFTLLDWKSSKAVTPDHFLQTGAYQLGLEESYDYFPPIQQRIILRVPKDGSDFEAKIVPTDINLDKETFLHLLAFQKVLGIYEQYNPYAR